MKIFFSVGEPSGDLHGANLIHELRSRCPELQAVGYGGPKMQAAGCDLHADLTELAVMWLKRVFENLGTFRRLVLEAGQYLRRERPQAVVLIDYPGFNWWIARQAKACGIPVYYYGPPQMWAWGGWRVRKMRRLVDHVLCKLPFEATWYGERGCRAHYIGHPYFDEMRRQSLDPRLLSELEDPARPLVTILPGSRTQEVESQLPWLLKAAGIVQQQFPAARFAVASFHDRQAELARRMVAETQLEVDVHVGQTPELIRAAHCCMACSGSVSLELLHHQKPSVILYHVSRLYYFLVRNLLLTVDYITLVNLLAAEQPFGRSAQTYDPDRPGAPDVPFPEYPTWEDKSAQLAGHVLRWLTDPRAYERKVDQLRELNQRFGVPGASQAAADYILSTLGRQDAVVPRRAA